MFCFAFAFLALLFLFLYSLLLCFFIFLFFFLFYKKEVIIAFQQSCECVHVYLIYGYCQCSPLCFVSSTSSGLIMVFASFNRVSFYNLQKTPSLPLTRRQERKGRCRFLLYYLIIENCVIIVFYYFIVCIHALFTLLNLFIYLF